MFEKDILQLIRGLRAHKGQEREYVQASLRECRKEVKSQDQDVKSIALLKLVYLEMFGHDMSWASFNVLEVMASQKFLQKRVGYLAAVQSFRPDTEVLMLAENLLKKDLGSTDKTTISLALSTIPHVVNPGMANSLLTDLLPRMSHSSPTIRKKTIVTLYRLAVVYPEVLRPSWPKIKERLLDEDEDASVTAAIVNVVCELGWRRPHDFLPLAPRFFDLLTSSGNNWMGIKIIKLFSVLTPLEPRLVKKLLPPLTQLIRTTPAMSLLYECINGIIQGGIMEGAAGTTEGDEVARLCISKLRGMLAVQNDPNLRYVALLAFAKITTSHAALVSEHQDAIMECLDDQDISIRTRALDLVIGMVNAENLQSVVDRLIKQLRSSGIVSAADDPDLDRGAHTGVEPLAMEDEQEAETSLKDDQLSQQAPPLPEHYRALVIERILEMCSKDMYANMLDFEWYINVLVDAVGQCPAESSASTNSISSRIGAELLNVAIRVKAVRPEAAAAAQSLLVNRVKDVDTVSNAHGALAASSFIAGEFASLLPQPEAVLTSLLQSTNSQLPVTILSSYIQAIPKIFVALSSNDRVNWTSARQSQIILLIARVTHFLEPLTLHPALEVQERAVEYLELFRLADEASKNHAIAEESGFESPPLLLAQAIPALFASIELNPVAPSAVRQVSVPEDLDLETPINPSLPLILSQAEYNDGEVLSNNEEVHRFYYEKPTIVRAKPVQARPAAELLDSQNQTSYQSEDSDVYTLEKKRAERKERYKDDPYYIDSERNSGTSTPMGSILRSAEKGEELNLDAIPVMELKLGNGQDSTNRAPQPKAVAKKPRRHFEIAGDETLASDNVSRVASSTSLPGATARQGGLAQSRRNPLEVDSSALSALSLESSGGRNTLDIEARAREEEEMARAIKEVERLRLAMQRRTEEAPGTGDGEGIVVKRRKKKIRTGLIDAENEGNGEVIEKKKKKKPKKTQATIPTGETAAEQPEVKKKKKKRVIALDEQPG